MKAIAYDNGPDSLYLTEVADPVPAAGEVIIDVAASAVNRADLLQTKGLYPPPPGASEIPGLECSGRISAVGEGVEGPAVGDEVCALLAGGGYAERVAVPAGQVMPVPEGVSLHEAASLPEVACTVWSNLAMTGGLGRGVLAADAHWGGTELGAPRVLIHGGAGGIGSHAIQVCRVLGARVATTAGGPEKVAMCRELGAELVIDYRDEDFVERVGEWTDDDERGRGVDLILDVMGAKYLEPNIASLAPDGRVVVIGLQGGVKGELNLGMLLPRRAGVLATNLRARPVDGPGGKTGICQEVVDHVWPMIAAGDVTTRVSREIPLERAAEALALLESGESHGKILLTVDGV
ncbi:MULTISPECIES: NAD(P)H-quinone oxidoreductase [Dietzia]|uniref:NADPH2:quinone reductase n=1 Tax=Dietzia cinnamea TaxID=321318 RepID=A0A4R3ZR18_9ACTN|nr:MULTISPECIES: NAD(P)H-quinone oxidoreductase [Dietzia]KZO58851.1 NAD(P)H-quinone oxidoreductase [Dietzia maris]AVM64315.1 NAD(P)H-quinone oxidoreductase [Dietzia sp. oral taxon 368]MBM7231375.1 NAD(P)H-quinone oxidoreductase [Dietzia cinnamea]MCT1640538.1 NAD(P)H-quinone oxidoreductase [Dietzia cinnamea]MCT1711722.1 NAD(P)H-quinone oxidoreductase [Dietzia cinnamea]